MSLFKWLFFSSKDIKKRKVIPDQPIHSVTTERVTDKISMNSLEQLPKFTSEQHVISMLDVINHELYIGKFHNSNLSHMLYGIVKDIKNYKKLSYEQLEYIKSLNREQLFFLFMLSNQMLDNLEAVLDNDSSPKYATINQKHVESILGVE